MRKLVGQANPDVSTAFTLSGFVPGDIELHNLLPPLRSAPSTETTTGRMELRREGIEKTREAMVTRGIPSEIESPAVFVSFD